MLHYRQAQAGASHITGTGPVNAVETLEKPLEMLSRNTVAVILNQDLVTRAGLVPNGHRTTLATELDPVVNQVCQHLFEPTRIRVDHYLGIDLINQRHTMRRGLRP